MDSSYSTEGHGHSHTPAHIPPPDLPQHRKVLGLKRHHLFGVIFLVVLLLVYLLLLVRPSRTIPGRQRPEVPIESNTDHPHPVKP